MYESYFCFCLFKNWMLINCKNNELQFKSWFFVPLFSEYFIKSNIFLILFLYSTRIIDFFLTKPIGIIKMRPSSPVLRGSYRIPKDKHQYKLKITDDNLQVDYPRQFLKGAHAPSVKAQHVIHWGATFWVSSLWLAWFY